MMLLLWGCSRDEGKSPTSREIVGTWVSTDGSQFSLKEDGTFMGSSIPADVFIINMPEYQGKKFDGSGTWAIKKKEEAWDQLPWGIDIDFNSTSDSDKYKCGTTILISGSGIMENRAPWGYIFKWQDEEGSERIKFFKK